LSALKKLLSQTAVYGLSSIIGRSMNFLLVPFYTSVMEPGKYGIVTEFYAYVAFLNIIYLYGMETAYFRFANKDLLREREIYNLIQSSILLSGFLLSSAFILFSSPLSYAMGYEGKTSYIIWLALVMYVDAAVAIPFARLRLQNQAYTFAVVKLANIFLNIGFNIFFLVICGDIYARKYLSSLTPLIRAFYDPSRQVEFVFISNLLANIAFIPMLWKPLVVEWKYCFRFEKIKPYLIYAYPIMIIGLAGMVNEMLSRIILKYMLSDNFYKNISKLEALGIFGACYKLSMFMTLAIQAFRYASEPFFFSRASDKNAPELFANVMKWFIILCAFIFLFISLYIDWFGLLLRKEVYRTGLGVVPVLLIANLFLGVYYNLSVWYKLTDRTYFGSYISLIGAGITILANVILIPVAGYMGAAVATLICYFSMAAISYYFGNQYFPVPYSLRSACFYLGLSVLLVFIVYAANVGKAQGFIFSALAILFYVGCVWLYEREELLFLKRKIRKPPL
jgi:O-antigen/teichoic acid export membrane protein